MSTRLAPAIGISLSWKLDAVPQARWLIAFHEAGDGAQYRAAYRYERRGPEWWAVLDHVEETMPARTPQTSGFGDDRRLPMMDEYGYSATAEAAQRRKEWADIHATEDRARGAHVD